MAAVQNGFHFLGLKLVEAYQIFGVVECPCPLKFAQELALFFCEPFCCRTRERVGQTHCCGICCAKPFPMREKGALTLQDGQFVCHDALK